MNNNIKLQTVQLVCQGKPCSEWLVTTREYGRFMMGYFDESICSYLLFKQESKDGEPLRVYHPGSKLGTYFDTNKFSRQELMSVFVKPASRVFSKLIEYNLANYKDFNTIKVSNYEPQKLLRLYTVDQIELYIKQNIDYNFNVSSVVLNPKQIKIKPSDLMQIIMPSVSNKSNKLFNPVGDRVALTLDEVENRLGYRVAIISKEGIK